MGRPQIKIDPNEILRWAKTGATLEDIALRLKVSPATIDRRMQKAVFKEALLAGRGELNISLRAKQVQVALGGNVPMLIFLGENYLGQSRSHRVVDKEGKDRPIVNDSPTDLLASRIAGIIERKRESGGTEGI